MRLKVYFFLFCFLLFSSLSFAEERDLNIQKSFEASVSINWGSVNGFVQTPAGGKPGTSSIKRPTLNELNIDHNTFYDLLLSYHWKKNSFYVGSQFIRLSGSGTLEKDLVSRIPFSAGTHFDSDIVFDWYRLGVSHSFLGQGNKPTISPKIELAFLDFSYVLDTPDKKVSRSYVKPALRVGAEVMIPFSGIIDLKIDGGTSVPFSNTPTISNLATELGVHIFPKKSRVDVRIFSRIGIQHIDYEDNQKLPNHIRLEIEPFLAAGLAAIF